MKRRMIPMLLTAAMIASSLSVSAFAAPFGDTNGHWGQKAIERWSGHGIVKGADGKFRPDDSLTRGELATIVSNLLKLSDMPAGNPFTDLDQNWYTDSILKCFEAGIMNGDGNTVRPNDPVTREEAMVILSNALRIAPKAGDVTGFDDAHMVSNWAEGAVNALLDSGVVNGVDADTLAPQGLINRASVVTILNNAIGNYVSEDGASIEANGGMVLVVGGDVTITGEADSVLILGGDKEVVMEDLKVEGDVLVEGADTKVVLNGETEVSNVTVAENVAGAAVEVGENASAGEVTVDAPKAEVSVAGTAENVTVTGEEAKVEVSGTVDVVAVGEAAANTEVTVTKDAEVGTLATEAEKTEVTVQGTVSDVKVSETADETSVKVESTGKVDTVDTAASDVSVSGKGEVSNVEASGDNTSVSTNGTKVEAAEGTTGVTAGNKDVAAGESATTSKPSSGGGGGSSSSSKPSHSHSYTAGTVVENGVEYNTCSCGAKEATGRVFVDTEEELATALAAGGTVELGGTITVSEELEITKDVIINGNGHDIESSASRVFQLRASDIEVTMNDLDMVSTAERVGTNNIRGINIDNNNYSGIVLTLNDCSFDFADESASDWSYAINVTGNNTGHTINIDGGSYEGANVINVWGNNHKITVENATLTSLYAYNSMYCGVCIKLEGTGIILNTSENTFNGDHALPIGFGENANDIQTSEDDNKNNTTVQVKDFDGLKRLAESHDCSIVAQMQNDIEADEVLVITNDSKFTIDGNGHKLTSSANRAINVNTAGEPVIKNLTILNEGSTYSYDDVRAINVIQKATNLTLKNVTADGFKYTINVAGSSVGSTIDIIGGKYTGYAALNITGSNTKVNVEDAVLASVNDASKHASNAFGTISVGDITADTAINNVIVTVDGGTLEAESEGNRQFLVTVQNAEAVTVTIKADQYIIENNDVFCIGSEDCSFYIEGVDCENTEVGGVHYGTMKPETVESTSEKSSETTNDESEQSDEGSEGNESAGSEEA